MSMAMVILTEEMGKADCLDVEVFIRILSTGYATQQINK